MSGKVHNLTRAGKYHVRTVSSCLVARPCKIASRSRFLGKILGVQALLAPKRLLIQLRRLRRTTGERHVVR